METKQGVIALLNANVVDRTFDVYANDYASFLDVVTARSTQPPLYPQPLIMKAPTVGEIAAFGNSISPNDLIAVVCFDLSSVLDSTRGNLEYIDLCAMMIEEQYKNFASGASHDYTIFHFRTIDPAGAVPELTRRILVNPTGPVNSNTELIILPALMAQNLADQGSIVVGGNAINAYTASTKGKFAYLAPVPLKITQEEPSNTTGAFAAVVVVGRNLGTYTPDQLTVKLTPMFGHYQTPFLLEEILHSVV